MFTNTFFPMKLIYGRKASKSCPKINSLDSFRLRSNLKHFCNTAESQKLLEDIIISYLDAELKKLGCSKDQYELDIRVTKIVKQIKFEGSGAI